MIKTSERNKDKTTKRILKVAAKLFAEQGFEATSTADIAYRAGVAQGTIFYYFPQKSDLIIAAIYQELSALAFNLNQKVKLKSDLRDLCLIFIEQTLIHNRFYSRLVKDLPTLPLAMQRLIFASLSGFSTHLVETIAHESADLQIHRRATLLSFFWFGLINYLYAYQELLDTKTLLAKDKTHLVEMFVRLVEAN